MTSRERAKQLYDEGMRCFCDLDNWEAERSTGHSCVCPIHKAVMAEVRLCPSYVTYSTSIDEQEKA